MFHGLSLPFLFIIFGAAAGAIWIAGIKLSDMTDVLSERLHLGQALGGVILLAIATNLPEMAITVSAALSGSLGVAVGNILGGIAIQTVVLVALDAFGTRDGGPLTYRSASLSLVLEGVLVIAVLTVAIMATQLPASLIAARLTPGAVLISLVWVAGVWLLSRAGKGLPWHDSTGDAPDTQPAPKGHSRATKASGGIEGTVSTARAGTVFAIAAAVTLVAGVMLEEALVGFQGGNPDGVAGGYLV